MQNRKALYVVRFVHLREKIYTFVTRRAIPALLPFLHSVEIRLQATAARTFYRTASPSAD